MLSLDAFFGVLSVYLCNQKLVLDFAYLVGFKLLFTLGPCLLYLHIILFRLILLLRKIGLSVFIDVL